MTCDLARTRCRQGAKAVTEPRARARCEVRGRRGTWVPTADAKGVIYACLEPGEGH